MRLILVLIFFLCVIDAFAAQVPASTKSAPRLRKKVSIQKPKNDVRLVLGAGFAGVAEKRNDNNGYSVRPGLAVRGGVEYRHQEFVLEASGFRSASSSSGVVITRQHEQVEAWYRYLFMPTSRLHPFLGAALGAQRDRVKTEFFNQSSSDVGRFESQLSVGTGCRIDIRDSSESRNVASMWFEGRLSTSNNYEPRVLPSGMIAIGGVF